MILSCLTASFASACAPNVEDEAKLGSPTLQIPTITPTETIAERGKAGDAVVTYSRTGGLAGASERWSIYLDGRVVQEGGRVGSIAVTEVNQLLVEIEAKGFFDWPEHPRSLDRCADCFTYSITVAFEGKINQITLTNAEADASEEAWSIVEGIQEILQAVSD